MIAMYRIWAVMLRHLYMQFRDTMRIFDITFWPVLDITLWGFVGFGVQSMAPTYVPLVFIPLLGAFFWQIVLRGSVDLTMGFLEELWSKNLANIAGSPLLFSEWIMGLMLLGCVRIGMVLLLGSLVLWALFGCTIFIFGWLLIPIFLLLLLSGWTLSHGTVLIMRWGLRIQNFAWAIGWAFTAFCGVFYSTDVLPRVDAYFWSDASYDVYL